jgi:hypothetical protein
MYIQDVSLDFFFDLGTVNCTSDYTLWTLYRFYFKSRADIKLQVYSVLLVGNP